MEGSVVGAVASSGAMNSSRTAAGWGLVVVVAEGREEVGVVLGREVGAMRGGL